MAVTSSLTQAYSISETGGSGISTSIRTSSVAPAVTLNTLATGVTMVYTTRFNLSDTSDTMFIDLYDTSLGDSNPDDRGPIRFERIYGMILSVESGVLSLGENSSTTTNQTYWQAAPVGSGNDPFSIAAPASMSFLCSDAWGEVSPGSRSLRLVRQEDSTAVGSITFIGEGEIIV